MGRIKVGLRTVLAGSMLCAGVGVGLVFVDSLPASAISVVTNYGVGNGPDGVSDDGIHVWVANSSDDTVTELVASTGAVVNTIDVGSSPEAISSDGTHVWVADWSGLSVTELDASTGAVVNTIELGFNPQGISSDGTHVWVTGGVQTPDGYSTLTELDASTGALVNTIDLGVFRAAYGVSSDGTHVWVTNPSADLVTEINASDGSVLQSIYADGEPVGISSDGTHVWVTNYASNNTVTELSTLSGLVVNTIDVGSWPEGISSDGTHVWVANSADETVTELDASTAVYADGTLAASTIGVGNSPTGISSDGTHVWVTNLNGNNMSEIGGLSFAVVLPSPPTLAITPGTVYVPVDLQVANVDASASPYATTLKWAKGTVVAPATALPKGLKLSSGGVLSGTPSKSLGAGQSSVSVKVTETVTTLNSKGKPVKTKTTIQATIPLIIS